MQADTFYLLLQSIRYDRHKLREAQNVIVQMFSASELPPMLQLFRDSQFRLQFLALIIRSVNIKVPEIPKVLACWDSDPQRISALTIIHNLYRLQTEDFSFVLQEIKDPHFRRQALIVLRNL